MRVLTIARAVWCLPCGAGNGQIRWFDEIDSTNTYLREQARQGAPDGLVAVADHQTAGRGRLDRRWESPPGANLLASVLLRPGCDPDDLHLCTGAVALAAADACAEVAGVEPALKWPNDLLVGGAKLAGVLAEAEFAGGALAAVVVGIGLNVAWPGPAGAGGTCLDDLGGDGAAGRPEGPARAPAGGAGRPAPPARRRRRAARTWPTRCAGAAPPWASRSGSRSPAERGDRSGRRPSTTPGAWWSRRPTGPRRVTAGDVVHLRPG